ncbi:MAG: 5-methylcytosine-specific restriction endonuclease system specificity protein McrC [Oscillospiraceae bacterium]
MAENIRIKNIYYMLAYAYQSLNEDGFDDVFAEEFDHIHDLFAAILGKGAANLIKRGLQRDYLQNTDVTGSLRGKIDITASVKQQTLIAKRMACHYDVYSENTVLNQILKITMLLLLRHGVVKPENRKILRKLLMYFAGVTEVDPNTINWSCVRYHRNNAAYRLLINICRLVIKGLLQTTRNGNYRLAEFIDDQQMYHLYEKFVLGYYKKEFPELSVEASYFDWDRWDEDDSSFLPVMKSDITLSRGDRVLIIDTKYYGNTMQKNTMFNSSSLISSNLYQIFTYVKNKDKHKTGRVSGILLYAKTDETIFPDNAYNIGGNRIGAKTLDLGCDWRLIKEQLNSLVEVYL